MSMLIEEGILKFEQQEENSVGIHSDTRRCVPTTNLAFDNHLIISFASANKNISLLFHR